MKISLFRIILAFVLSSNCIHAAVLMADDFNDNALNGAIWTTSLSLGSSPGTPSVTEVNQRLEIKARGYLNTANDYNPLTNGGIKVTGTFTFLSFGPGDLIRIVTRGSGTPTNYASNFGEITSGISFVLFAANSNSNIEIEGHGGAAISGGALLYNTLNLSLGDTLLFEAVDDGLNLSYTLEEVGDPTSAAKYTASSSFNSASNKISFYNREYDSNVVAIDNVSIQSVPETSSVIFLSVSVALGTMVRKRKTFI